jgi:hypothetical protein
MNNQLFHFPELLDALLKGFQLPVEHTYLFGRAHFLIVPGINEPRYFRQSKTYTFASLISSNLSTTASS